jgi:hypothetical protein
MGNIETRTEPDLEHRAFEAGGDTCPHPGELASAEHYVGEPG